MNSVAGEPAPAAPTFREALGTWGRIGCLSFGGPAGQIAMMHKILVDEKKWLDEKTYLTALNFCMLLPGPEAMQLATYAGWRLHGTLGGLAAGLLFVLPGAALMLALAIFYAMYGNVPVAEALFVGIKAAVLAIVVEALLRVARRALKSDTDWLIAAAAFMAIFFFGVPFPVIVIAAALTGYLRGAGATTTAAAPSAMSTPVPFSQTLRTVLLWLAIWIVPLAAIVLAFGPTHVLSQLAWFFSKLAVVTFGGAYAVLAYMAQDVVQTHGWLAPGEMLDALGLAETTPGPLILVTEFVGTLAAWRHGGGTPLAMGLLGALVTLWATFAPCFLWIFAGAPYIERLNANPKLKAALAAVTAAVVGVILNLTVWFALHVLFGKVSDTAWGPLRLHLPDLATLQPVAVVLSALAFVLLFALHRGIVTTLAICGALAVGWHYLAV
ncbi:MAG: chromate efflux transporter [Hyphomicrobium sp.]